MPPLFFVLAAHPNVPRHPRGLVRWRRRWTWLLRTVVGFLSGYH